MRANWMFIWTALSIICAVVVSITPEFLDLTRVLTLCAAVICSFLYGFMRGEGE